MVCSFDDINSQETEDKGNLIESNRATFTGPAYVVHEGHWLLHPTTRDLFEVAKELFAYRPQDGSS